MGPGEVPCQIHPRSCWSNMPLAKRLNATWSNCISSQNMGAVLVPVFDTWGTLQKTLLSLVEMHWRYHSVAPEDCGISSGNTGDTTVLHQVIIMHWSISWPLITGYYCNVADAPISDYTNYPCPMGYYCLNGTEWAEQHGCPPGTYNPYTLRESVDECTACDAGSFCNTSGQTGVTGESFVTVEIYLHIWTEWLTEILSIWKIM